MASPKKPKLLFVVTEDWYFLSHRSALARSAQRAGFEVHLATRVGEHGRRLADEGIVVHPLAWKRGNTNPLDALKALTGLVGICRRTRPDIVHYVAMKPILVGAFCQLLAPPAYVVNAVSGLGSVYSHKSPKTRLLRRVVNAVLALFLRRQNGVVIVQNQDDGDFFGTRRFVPRDGIVLIPGSGIDTDRFRPVAEPPGDTIVASVVSRMLWDKGIGETVEAARILAERDVPARLRLIGAPDPENPNSVDEDQLVRWDADGVVEWMGARTDIERVWAESHIAVLASYREGLPKSLLEAAACGRPLVTTDTSGCRMLVKDGDNGLVVPVRDAEALADAIERLARDRELRARVGRRARELAVTSFSDKVVNAAVLRLYRAGLDKAASAAGHSR